MQLDFRMNARPSRDELDALSVAVGWSPFGADYPAVLDGYAVTTSAWTTAERLVGWTSVVSDHVRHAFLLDVMVHPDFQRRGIGRQLLHRAIDAMRARGVTAFHVDCAPDRAGFYEKCGFKMCAGGWLDTANSPTPLAASREVTIRPMRDDEAQQFLQIHHAAVREIAAKDYSEAVVDAWARPITEAVLQGFAKNPDQETRIVAEQDGALVGLGAIVIGKSELRACYVAPTSVRRGIGRAIVEQLEAIAREYGLEELHLESSVTAEPFYMALGYQVESRGVHVLASGVPMVAVRMTKRLS